MMARAAAFASPVRRALAALRLAVTCAGLACAAPPPLESKRGDLLAAASEALARGDTAAAESIAAQVMETGSDDERARAAGVLARSHLARGAIAESIARFEDALFWARDKRPLDCSAARDAFALSYIYTQRVSRLRDAARVLGHAERHAASCPDASAELPYYRGLVAFELGSLREALALFRAAHALALGRGERRLVDATVERLAATQHALGRDDDAIATLAAHAPTDGAKGACDDVDRALTRGWLLVEQARAARFGRVGSPPAHGDTADDVARSARALAEGAALFAQAEDVDAARCADPYRRAHAALNAGFAALERGELGVARAALGRAAERLPALADAMGAYARLLEGEIAEADGRNDDAVRALEHATRAAESAGTPEPLHRARVALGRVHLGRGQHREAIEVLGAAERALEPRSASAPFGEGRPSFLARHRDSAAWLVEAHLRAGDARAARSAARTAERRLSDALVTASRLTSLSEERRMRVAEAIAAYREGRAEVAAMRAREHELPRDERTRVRETRIAREHALNLALDEALAASAGFASGGEARRDARAERHERTLAPAEVALDLARAGDGWVAFAEDGGRLRAHRFHGAPPKDAHALGALLMRPLAATLRTATRVLVRASGPFATLDVHALPLDGAPLIERLAVAYAIDARRGDAAPDAEAATPPESGAPGERAPAALVVGDPNDNLRFAERDARWSAERLLGSGFTPTVLVGSEATSVAILSALPRASHFHFAGHAAFSGEDLWATALASSAGGAITFGDILALHRAPRTVVLSACEAARTTASSGSLGNGLGLAHAFVLAGSASVVAPTRRVDDALAATIAARVAAGVSTDSPDLASALREAQRAARREDPSADWAAFRVVVP